MKKRWLAGLLCVVMILCNCVGITGVAAAENVTVVVDGQVLSFDVPPQLIGGRTMVPLRAIFEALGATVGWDDATQTVTAYNEAYMVKCSIGSNTMYVNNVAKTIDVAPMMIDDRTLVPARFIAEGFNCDVQWDATNFVVTITSKPIDYTQVEQGASDTSVVTPTKHTGTRANPYSATDGVTIPYQEWSFEPVRYVSITCTNVIRGTRANNLAESENRYNEDPNSNQEWIFFEFDVNYISSQGGEDDVLEGSDVIYEDTFFTASGAALPVQDMATLGDVYSGKGVFDVELYPGASGKVVIGLLTDKNVGDILLRVPYKSASTNTWISCMSGNESASVDTDTNVTVTPSRISYYSGSTLPTYTSVVGTPLKDTYPFESGGTAYIYNYIDGTYVNYITSLPQYGWELYKKKTDDASLTCYMIKGNDLVSVVYNAKYDEVWILVD